MNQSYADRPLPSEIQYELNRMTVGERTASITSYLGLRLHWQTRFFDLISLDREPVMQASFTQRGMHRHGYIDVLIIAIVDTSLFPELMQVRRGRSVDLYGTLVNVDSNLSMGLELDRCVVLPESLLDRIVEHTDSQV